MNEAYSAKLAIIISYPTSTSGIIEGFRAKRAYVILGSIFILQD